jgi:hypothetical protein
MIGEKIEITANDTPWEIACMLINAQYSCKNIFGQDIMVRMFELEDLRCIGQHLVNFCECEAEKERSRHE